MNDAKVPDQFILSSYLEEEKLLDLADKNSFEAGIEQTPLYFDILAKLEVEALKPWLKNDLYIPVLIEKWKMTEPSIASLFKTRNRLKAKEPMQEMILTFIAFLFWTNNLPVSRLKNVTEDAKNLSVKPVNVQERLSYILATPDHHHAFTQLQQLYIEFKKKYAVTKLKKQ